MMKQQEKYVAFFDIDKTLLTVNSSIPLILTSYKRGLMKTTDLLKAVWLSIVYKLRIRNAIDATEAMAFWLKGVTETTVAEISRQLVTDKLIPSLRASVLKEIEYHKSKGARMVILSASLSYTCNPLARHLDIDDVICSSMEVKNGVFTGKPQGNICIEGEKEIRMRDYCQQNGFDLQKAYCYGDSYSDRFIMEACGNPVCVSPDSRLQKLAKKVNGG